MKNIHAVFRVLSVGLVWLLCSCGGNADKAGPESVSSPEVAAKALLANPKQGLDGLKSYHMHAVKEFR